MKSKNTLLDKLPQQKWFYPLCAFLIPFLGMLAVMYIGNTLTENGTSRYSPFGDWSMLYSDTYHQYYPFFKEFRRALLAGESLLYNWSVGLGLDYLGLLSYYLASPLNLLSVFVPESALLGYFSLLTPIRLGLAGMFFCIFLQQTFHKYDASTSVFAGFYGLCAWAMGYLWNVMWLDTFALLPLVMLGMVSMFRDRKFILYTITLALSVAINYYIGFFTCIFVLLTFICYQICRWRDWRSFCKDFGMIALFSAIALAMTAVLSLPTLAALQNTQSSVNTFPKDFRLNMVSQHDLAGLLDAMMQVAGNMNGGISPTFKEGLPNVYCGIFSTVLLFLYLLNKEIRLRDKICATVLLLFLNASFAIRQLDYIWHGFHFTNMIPYRFSFLYSFVALYMAYCAWINRKSIRLWHLIFAAAMSAGIMLCYKEYNKEAFLAYNVILAVLYIAVLVGHCIYRDSSSRVEDRQERKQLRMQQLARQAMRQRICSIVFLFVMGGELVLNLVNFGTNFTPTSVMDYPRGTTATADVIDHMHKREEDTLFYRAETTQTSTLNGGALNGYNGITTFTSSANVKVTEFMQQLGYAAKNTYNRYAYEEASPVANLFLGLKYMIVRDGRVEENPYFDDVYSNGNVHLLENNAYLPLGFLANSQLLNLHSGSLGNRFGYQNSLMQAAAGLDTDVWYILPGKDLNISANGPSIIPQPNTGYCSYTTSTDNTGNVVFTYTADRAGFMCVDMDLSQRNTFSIYYNNTFLYNDTYSLPQMASVCAVKPGDVVEVRLKCENKNESGTLKVSAAILDEETFRKGYAVLAESALELASFENTRIQGSIACKRDGILYTSIPQNGNWYAIVDGKPAETVLLADAMVGLMLTEGTHTIEFVYRNSAYRLGLGVTIISATVLVAAYLIAYHPELFRKLRKKDVQ